VRENERVSRSGRMSMRVVLREREREEMDAGHRAVARIADKRGRREREN
jgi:hypothetical protein